MSNLLLTCALHPPRRAGKPPASVGAPAVWTGGPSGQTVPGGYSGVALDRRRRALRRGGGRLGRAPRREAVPAATNRSIRNRRRRRRRGVVAHADRPQRGADAARAARDPSPEADRP